MDCPGAGRGAGRVRGPVLVREDRDQPPVAGVEVQVAVGRVVEVRLLEHKRHTEHAFPEVDRGLPVGAHERDVMDALALDLAHGVTALSDWKSGLSLYGRHERRAARK